MSDWKKHFDTILRSCNCLPLRLIGEGPQSSVILCKDRQHKTIIALKIIDTSTYPPGDPLTHFCQTLGPELQQKSHPQICKILGCTYSKPFLVIKEEFIEAPSLARKSIYDQLDTIERKLTVSVKIAQGLESLHSEGLVHGNLKSANILLPRNGEPVITDCGQGRPMEISWNAQNLLRRGEPAAWAPEYVFSGNETVQTDIYALGIVLFEFMTGHHPYPAATREDLIQNHISAAIPHVTGLSGVEETTLKKLFTTCLAKNPKDRYSSVGDIVSDIMVLYWGKKLLGDSQGRKRVLIVDDEKMIVKLLKSILEMLELEVLTAFNGREALDIAFREKPDLICLDIMMPELSGIEVAEILSGNPETHHIPLVIISAKDDRDFMIYGRNLGIRDYLVKPFNYSDIEQRLPYWIS